jgi:curved DNA-binding protein CbpA
VRPKKDRIATEAAFDPYAALGVDRTATKEQIKKAYYDLAKQHHPDAGGEEDAFLPVKLAYETLIDDQKRVFFDTFGVTPGSAEANEINAACQGLRQLFLELLQRTHPEQLKRLDIVAALRRRLEDERAKNQEGLKALAESEKRLNAVADILAAKLTHSDPKHPNVFLQSVQTALEGCAAQRQAVTSSIAVQSRAMEILKSFRFDFDEQPMQSIVFGGFTSTTVTGVW